MTLKPPLHTARCAHHIAAAGTDGERCAVRSPSIVNDIIVHTYSRERPSVSPALHIKLMSYGLEFPVTATTVAVFMV